jgi:UDP-3-O-[3-hydroxymyristoyl] N-acetylglucosamine deacetylase
MTTNQLTLKREIGCDGIGLHTGKKVNLTLKPAEPDSGICFFRIDLPDVPVIQAKNTQVVATQLATSLGYNGHRISTVEHLMAALSGLGIDNAAIELNAPEVPIMDGSAYPFIEMIRSAGVAKQQKPKKYLAIKRAIEVRENGSKITLLPGEDFKISFTIDFDHPLMQNQSLTVVVGDETFINEIGRARTFGFLEEVENLKKNGFAKGGSLENAIVIDRSGVLNGDGLRFQDEFVRHKILDLIGDLFLVGMPIQGHVIAHKSGHTLHQAAVRALLSDPGNFEVITPKNGHSLHA